MELLLCDFKFKLLSRVFKCIRKFYRKTRTFWLIFKTHPRDLSQSNKNKTFTIINLVKRFIKDKTRANLTLPKKMNKLIVLRIIYKKAMVITKIKTKFQSKMREAIKLRFNNTLLFSIQIRSRNMNKINSLEFRQDGNHSIKIWFNPKKIYRLKESFR